jgi:glycosyltransferase involved in cell wall biosynthesis
LYKLFDIFVHTPIDEHSEAFGQVYIEAMAAGVPLICTISGIAHNLIQDKKNALVVPYKNSDKIFEAILTLLNDKTLRENLINQAKQDVVPFSLEKKINRLKELYFSKTA